MALTTTETAPVALLAEAAPVALMTEPLVGAGVSAPLREFLVWVARCPRSYADAMEAWRSSCPRFTVWEDALAAGLIHVEAPVYTDVAQAVVQLTPRGAQLVRA